MEMEELKMASWVIWGVIFWATLFLIIRTLLFPKRSFDFCNRSTSTVHAIMSVSLAALSVQDWTCPVCPLASSSPSQMKALAVTLSYLIYDLICTILGNRCTVDNTVHHFISIIGIGAGLAYQKCGTELVATLLITEISSPFLHMREILKEFGIRDTHLNLLVDILFAVIFSVARMVAGPHIVYVTIITANNPLMIKAMALGLQLISAFWFYKILRMLKYKLNKRNSPNKTLKTN